MKSKISIDIDDVIADSTEALRLLVNERTGASLTKDDYHEVGGEYWSYYERVWKTHGIHDQVSFKHLSMEMAADQSHVPLLPGAESAIRQLAERFHVVFITARDKSWEVATRRWFHERFSHDDVELYFCESHKDTRAKTKGQLCKELGVVLHIDDNEAHCQTVTKEGIRAILFGHYGWHSGTAKDAVTCADWTAVMEYITKTYGGKDKGGSE